MQLNTRNFLLYLLLVAFLVVGIFSTVITDLRSSNTQTAGVIVGVDNGQSEYLAKADEKKLDRTARLKGLREQISELNLETVDEAPVEEVVVSEVENPATKPQRGPAIACGDYQLFSKGWSADNLVFSVSEGARVIYRKQTVSSTTSPELAQTLVLQLPLQSTESKQKSCLPHDVVAIALDGSLVRNSEYALYSIFGEETLLGYALDGFPLYGKSKAEVDECGGASVDGQYRYYLSEAAGPIISCFSGLPVEL